MVFLQVLVLVSLSIKKKHLMTNFETLKGLLSLPKKIVINASQAENYTKITIDFKSVTFPFI